MVGEAEEGDVGIDICWWVGVCVGGWWSTQMRNLVLARGVLVMLVVVVVVGAGGVFIADWLILQLLLLE